MAPDGLGLAGHEGTAAADTDGDYTVAGLGDLEWEEPDGLLTTDSLNPEDDNSYLGVGNDRHD